MFPSASTTASQGRGELYSRRSSHRGEPELQRENKDKDEHEGDFEGEYRPSLASVPQQWQSATTTQCPPR